MEELQIRKGVGNVQWEDGDFSLWGGHAQSHDCIVLGCCVENDFLLPLNGSQHPKNLNSSQQESSASYMERPLKKKGGIMGWVLLN